MGFPIIVRTCQLPDDNGIIRKLWIDYLTWGNDNMQLNYGVHPHDPVTLVADDMMTIEKFLPPSGTILLAFSDSNPCGIGCLKRINNEIGEIKRIYVDPNFRKKGVGNAIIQNLINAAIHSGYKKIRLDSPKFMIAAHALYKSFGFKEINVYPEVEIPENFRQYLIFMELNLETL